MPLRNASASTFVSTRRRIKMTLIVGRVTRRVSASDAAASRSTEAPSTMAYSSGDSDRRFLSSSRELTTCELLPVTDIKTSALDGLLSTRIGMWAHLKRFVGVAPGPGVDLGLVVEQREVQVALGVGEHDLLGLALVDGQREQGLGKLLGGLRALRSPWWSA